MRGVKLIAALALALALYAAAMVGTASGGLAREAAQVWNCDPEAYAPVGRGGVVREPSLDEVHADLPASAKGKAGKSFKATVPVYFHVQMTRGRWRGRQVEAEADATAPESDRRRPR